MDKIKKKILVSLTVGVGLVIAGAWIVNDNSGLTSGCYIVAAILFIYAAVNMIKHKVFLADR